jgi:L-asparaginase II
MDFTDDFRPNVFGVRGADETIETQHMVSASICHAEDGLVWSWGVPLGFETRPLFLRSAAKPFQAVTAWRFLGRGLQEHLLNHAPEILAVMQASHTGTHEHVRWVEAMLNGVGLDATALKCPHAWPLDTEARQREKNLREIPLAVTHNCSGKHAVMLMACCEQGWPLENYDAIDHPLQQAILSDLSDFCSADVGTIACSVDGCGVPVHALPWLSVARVYATFPHHPQSSHLARAMGAYPLLVGGPGRIDSEVIRLTQGRLLCKVGADGVLAASYPEKHLGLIFKLWDGQLTLRNSLFLAVLLRNKWLTRDEYDALLRQVPEWSCCRKTDTGLEIGRYVFSNIRDDW